MYVADEASRWLSKPAGRLYRAMLYALPLAVLTLWSADAQAYAWMVRHGYAKCSSCHTDPSGGETLTHMGRVQGVSVLAYNWDEGPAEVTDQAKLLNGVDEPDSVRLGGSVRGMGIVPLGDAEAQYFPMQLDIYGSAELDWLRVGGSIGASKSRLNNVNHTRAAQLTSADEGVQAVSRNHWIGVDLGDHALLRAGRINQPFGIRGTEHTLWTRDATKTDRESDQQHGIALAFWGGPWRAEWMLNLGNYQIGPDKFRERGYAGYAEYLLSGRTAVGISSTIMQSKSGTYYNPSASRQLRAAHGLMVRTAPWDVAVILAEVDILKNTGAEMGYTGFVQADFEPLQGLHFMLTGEFLDRGKPEDGAARPGAGELNTGIWASANWFLWPHLDLRMDAVFRSEEDGQILAQGHYFF